MKLKEYRADELKAFGINPAQNAGNFRQLQYLARTKNIECTITYQDYVDVWLSHPDKLENRGVGGNKYSLIRTNHRKGFTPDNISISNLGGSRTDGMTQVQRNTCGHIRRLYNSFQEYAAYEIFNMRIIDCVNTSGKLTKEWKHMDPNDAFFKVSKEK